MTERLYRNDPYLVSFTARILEVEPRGDRLAVVLDRTAFYPTSGGQPHDRGALDNSEVVEVVEEEARVLHLVARDEASAGLRAGRPVAGRIDWERRFDHMQQHCGQHLLSAAALRLLEAGTTGFHLGGESCTIDLAIPSLTDEQIYRMEELANRVVWEDRPVIARIVDEAELATLPLRKVPTVNSDVRIVEVKDYDWSPCGGTHPRHTGEVGLIAVLGWERYKGGTRLEFVCGRRVLLHHRKLRTYIRELVRSLSVAPPDLGRSVAALQQFQAAQASELKAQREQLAAYWARELWAGAERLREGQQALRLVVHRLEGAHPDALRALAAKLSGLPGTVAALGVPGSDGKAQVVLARSPELGELHCGELLKSLATRFDGRGGGSPAQAQGGFPAERLDEVLEAARNELRGAAERPVRRLGAKP